ncbi:MAG: hypothetical protein U1F57_05230 [bacterium]
MKKVMLLIIIFFFSLPTFADTSKLRNTLKQKLLKKYPAEVIEVTALGETDYDFIVGFLNPSFLPTESGEADNNKKTKEIALFVKANYLDIQNVKTLAVIFKFSKTPLSSPILNLNNTRSYSSYFDVKKDL